MSDTLLKIDSQITYQLSFILREAYPGEIFSITEVHTNADLSLSQIWISRLKDGAELVDKMNENQKTFRYELAKKVKLRKMPELKFILDSSSREYQKIDDLLKKA